MTDDFDWIAEYYQWLKNGASTSTLDNGWTVIGTPFFDRHNDGLNIYAKKDGNNITLSDDGYIISDLMADGISLSRGKRKQLLETFLASYGVVNKKNELIMNTSVSSYPVDMHMFLQAMLAVNDMFFLSGNTVKTIFLDDVVSYLDEQDIVYTPNFIAKGSTGLEFNFNFQIAGKKTELLINAFNSINKSNLTAFLFDWIDIKEARQRQSKKNVRGLAIINDVTKEIDSKYLEALSAKETDYILFSERNRPENISKLNVA